MRQIESAREVVERLGGIKAVAALTGRKTTTVSAWQAKFGSFPSETYSLMRDELAKLGYSAPRTLWRQIVRANSDQEAVDASH